MKLGFRSPDALTPFILVFQELRSGRAEMETVDLEMGSKSERPSSTDLWPKTESSIRDVKLPRFVVEALR
jgi:hypothetical protein